MKQAIDYQNPEFIKLNKEYYQNIENYDWVVATDHFVGLETFFHRLRQQNLLNFLKPYLKEYKGDEILDAGCGTGLFSRYLPAGAIAFDINPRHVAKAKTHAPNINFLIADIEDIPFKNDYFSLVICSEVLEHLPSPNRALSEICRVLKPGGIFIGTVPNRSLIWKLRFLSSTRPQEPYHYYYQRNELKKKIEQNFDILILKKTSCLMSWFFAARKNAVR